MRLAAGVLLGLLVAACGDGSVEAAAGETDHAPSTAASPALDTAVLASIPLDSLRALGQAAYTAQRLDEAEAIWELGLQRAREAGDSATEAHLLTSIALAAYWASEYERARRLAFTAREVAGAHGELDELPRAYNALLLIAWQQGRLTEAASWSDSTLAAARAVDDPSYHAKALVNLGNLETALGEIESARRHMQQGLAALRELGDVANEGRTLVNLAALERDAGNAGAALEHAAAALELARESRDTAGEEAALGQLASLYLLVGRHEAAIATVDSALRRAREAGLRAEEAANLEILAGLHRQLGHLPRALSLYDSAYALNRELEERAYETGLDLYHMAEIQTELGNLDVARTRVERAREFHHESGWTTAELSDVLLLAEIEELAGGPERADEHLAVARRIATDLGLRTSRLDVALVEARIADHRGDDVRTLAVLDTVAADLPVAGFAAESEALALRARALARSGDLAAAETAGRRAVELVGRARTESISGMLRSTLAHSRAEAYAGLVDILLRQGRSEEAYETAASAGTWRDEREAEGGRDAARREELLGRIDQLAAGIRDAELRTWNPDVVAEPVARLEAVRQEYERMRPPGPGTGSPSGESGAASSVAMVSSSLRPNEAVLQYLVGDDHAFAFLVTPGGVTARRLDVAPNALATRIRLARRLLDDPLGADATEVLETLHTELIGPVAEGGRLDGVDRLIVIPHGVLTYLPFAALRNPATGRWLAEETVLQHLPAVAMLTASGRARREAVAGSDGPGTVFAPLTAELPATRYEARAVAGALHGGARLEVGDGATERAVRTALVSGGIVHIASHAELNVANPMHSEIRLAGGGSVTTDSASDGRLEVRELLALSIDSPLVFLSGCETGLGTGWSSSYAAGEDFATLERALLEAGAGSVVATLWRIEDEGAADFASRFYGHLANTDPAVALARAQREQIADSRYAHPFYWAAYRVAGEGRSE